MPHIDAIQSKYPQRISADIFDGQGNSKHIDLGFVMSEDSKRITVKTCVDGAKDDWKEISIPKKHAKIVRLN